MTCFILFFSSCATIQAENQSQSARLEFALIGDMPYNAKQKKQFTNLIKEINAANLSFVVHAGDYWFDGIAWKKTTKGLPPCSNETYQDRLNLTKKIKHPFIITPGDNDWTDCHRAKPRAYDPLDRLAKLRKMFFKGDHSLGKRTMRLTRQSKNSKYAKFRENVRWTYGDVLFVTLHMVGSNNNLGRTPEMDTEYEERNAANLVWLEEAFKLAKLNGNKAIMIISQANPRFETTWTPKVQKRYMLAGLGIEPPKERRETGFDDFVEALGEHTLAFGKPVAYVHGDTHTFRIDKPLLGSTSRRMIENFTRVETYGFPDTHWVRVTIDPEDPNVFRFRQQIVKENLVKH
jgi:predicted phosphodiesterase